MQQLKVEPWLEIRFSTNQEAILVLDEENQTQKHDVHASQGVPQPPNYPRQSTCTLMKRTDNYPPCTLGWSALRCQRHAQDAHSKTHKAKAVGYQPLSKPPPEEFGTVLKSRGHMQVPHSRFCERTWGVLGKEGWEETDWRSEGGEETAAVLLWTPEPICSMVRRRPQQWHRTIFILAFFFLLKKMNTKVTQRKLGFIE